MATDHRSELKDIRTFPSLVRYLHDQMGWPIATSSFDDLTFEYTAEELGIDAESAAKIQDIKRLRPLSANQPWGIFFVKFEPKRLPIVALRRILSRVALKKRASANSAERAAWAADDLLFVSNYGEGDERQISFAHFSQAHAGDDLPTLKVLGWDNLDTALHLDAVVKELTQSLAWPADEDDVDGWRKRWCAAFTLRPREVITTSRELSIRLATLAGDIRDRIKAALRIETERGPLTRLMKAFQTSLIHNLKADDFADMYAQTIAYGLLSARIADPHKKTVDDFAGHMRTNPFLRELMETFLKVGGRRGKSGGQGIDFDELGVSDVVALLDNANMEAIVRDFGDKNPQEDPVIHFYELFLKEYDAQKRMQRGVFYTPRPVVSYIVHSVDELLRTEFGLEDGLADTTTWGAMVKRNEDLTIPEGTSPDQAFVQILDPATGTGTFLVEVIDIIHKTMVAKWTAQSQSETKIALLWNAYVPQHLLTRLHAYELLMAPYAIAHLKVGLKLYETGYHFGSDERARIYLTNALERPSASEQQMEFAEWIPALAHEAYAVDEIKRNQRFTVVIGNPPYSGHSWNLTPALRRDVEAYRFVDAKRIKEKGALQLEKSIQDDYVKFFRSAELHVAGSNAGVVGLVTSHGFLDNPFLRGMRWSVLSTFQKLFVLDLHGNALRHAKAPDGSPDKNVFDIQRTGVAVSLLRRLPDRMVERQVHHSELWGDQGLKYRWLASHSIMTTPRTDVFPKPPTCLLIPQDSTLNAEYDGFISIGDILPVNSKGVVTGRDAFVIDFDKDALLERMRTFASSSASDEVLVRDFDLNPSAWWDVAEARRKMPPESQLNKYVRPLLYRPFDVRHCFYHPAVLMSPRRPVMKNVDKGMANILLVTSKMTKGEVFRHVTVARGLAEAILLSSKTSNNAIVFPLYLYPDESLSIAGLNEKRQPNVTPQFVRALSGTIGLPVRDGEGDGTTVVGFDDLLRYLVAILHSPEYRARYVGPLSREFPRIPLPGREIFWKLSRLGAELVAFHLMESPILDHFITTYSGPKNPEVGRVGWSNETVWLDAGGTKEGQSPTPGIIGFSGVTEAVWNFHVGGYQVCEKWLKDRKGRTLSKEDVTQYQKIVVSLNEIIRVMNEIDSVIERHGGWPGAFTQVDERTADERSAAEEDDSVMAAFSHKSPKAPYQSDLSFVARAAETEAPAHKVRDAPKLVTPRIDADDLEREDLMYRIRQLFSDGQDRLRDEAIAALAHELGYQRTGTRIQEELDNALRTAVRRGIISSDGALRLAARSIEQYGRHFLKDQFLASLSGRQWIERDEAVRSFARWLGFRRVGPSIEDSARSLINGLLREGRLEGKGVEIRRS